MTRGAMIAFACLLGACADGSGPPEGAPPDPGEPPTNGDGRWDDLGEAPDLSTRRVARLSARQLQRSLEVATGQRWSRFEEYAATLGEPDYDEVVETGRQLSVVVERLAQEAAREVCAVAVAEEAERPVGNERPVLGEVELTAPTREARLANLRRLLLRFHGHRVDGDTDPRLAPWRTLLEEPVELADPVTPAELEALRWEAVCVGLIVHPDFLTY